MNKSQGKAVISFSALVDYRGFVAVAEKPDLHSDTITIGEVLKMHAAIIETAHRRAIEAIGRHSDSEQDALEGDHFFHDCIEQSCKKLDDLRLLDLLKSRATDNSGHPLEGVAGVVDAARAVVASEKTEGGALPTKELDSLRRALASVGIEE